MPQQLSVVVIGGGMYVSGRGTSDFGTVLPAISEWAREGRAGRIAVAATSSESGADVRERASRLAVRTGVPLDVRTFPESGAASDAYLPAIAAIPRPACAIIAVPDHLHHNVASATIAAGLPTLVVKPLTPTVAEAEDLIELLDRHRTYGAVEFHKRWDRANLKLREAVQSGLIGSPLTFQVLYTQRRSVPADRFRTWSARTNIFQYLGVHYVDIIRFATGALPVSAYAIGQKQSLAADGIDTYDSIEAIVEWQMQPGHRFASVFVTGWVDPEITTAASDQRISVIGTRGRFESDQKRRGIELTTSDRGIEQPNPDFCVPYANADGTVRYCGYGIDSIVQFLRDADAITQGRLHPGELEDVRPTFRQAMASVAVVQAVNESLALGGARVPIDAAAAMTARSEGRAC